MEKTIEFFQKEQMKRIFKYTIDIDNGTIDDSGAINCVAKMPKGAKFLSLQWQWQQQWQYDGPVIWAIVDDVENQFDDRKIVVYPTGADVTIPTQRLSFLGTTQHMGICLHYFEVMPINDSIYYS